MNGRFKFKVWDKKKNLLTRPGTVIFSRGEFILDNCVILQYTGFEDKLGQEIYEDDILLIGENKYHVYWDEQDVTWNYKINSETKKLSQKFTSTTIRGYNANEKAEQDG
jgi:YopX protein